MTKTIKPPLPFGCRRPPPSPVSLLEPFNDELGKRLQLHAFADEILRGVLAPGDSRHVRPSFRLYTRDFRQPSRTTRARDDHNDVWRGRYIAARIVDAQHLSISGLLTALANEPLLCRDRRRDPLVSLLAYYIGQEVHARVMAAYRSAYRDDRISCDNRVYFPDGTSERLSVLAKRDTRSIYGGLSWSLAGQRCDIINIDRHETWEIKPASLASAATLQLWGYLDNYEVARMTNHYRRDPALPSMSAGTSLPSQVTERFDIELDDDTTLAVTPFTQSNLPGLILYSPQVERRRKRPDKARARQAVGVAQAEVSQLLVTARRDLQHMIEVQDAENRRLLIYAGVTVLVVCLVAAAVAAPAVAAAEGVELTVVAAEAAAAAETPTAIGAAVEVIAEVGTKIAASVTLYLAGRQFTVPPETASNCIGRGCEIGEAVTASASLR